MASNLSSSSIGTLPASQTLSTNLGYRQKTGNMLVMCHGLNVGVPKIHMLEPNTQCASMKSESSDLKTGISVLTKEVKGQEQ
jgi:hypothetical protein